jgi:hypothetical protein
MESTPVASELAKLGLDVAKDTVAKYMPKPPGSLRGGGHRRAGQRLCVRIWPARLPSIF